MIRGVVNARDEATIHLSLKNARGEEQELEFVIDTGFNGSLTLPPGLIRSLELPWRTRGSAVMANGEVDQFDIYAATLMWNNTPRRVLIEEADTEPLVCMALLRGHDVAMRVVDGGPVTIVPLPQ